MLRAKMLRAGFTGQAAMSGQNSDGFGVGHGLEVGDGSACDQGQRRNRADGIFVLCCCHGVSETEQFKKVKCMSLLILEAGKSNVKLQPSGEGLAVSFHGQGDMW